MFCSEIYGLLAKHKELWEKMKELEKSEEQPDRYKNRGGQLLKEEKERNKLSKRVTLTEEKLTALAEQFYVKEGTPFLVYGRTIEEHINDLHETQKAVSIVFSHLNDLVIVGFVIRKGCYV